MSARIDARKMELLDEHYERIKDREDFRTRNVEKWKSMSDISLIILITDFIFLSYLIIVIGAPASSLFIISLNLPFISLIIYFLFILIFYVSIHKRRFYSSEVELTLEEVLFLRFLEIYKNANRVSKEKRGIVREEYKKELVNRLKSVMGIVEDYGSINMSLINDIIGKEIDRFKLNFDKYLYSNIIVEDESDLNKICDFLLDISEYMLYPRLDKLEWINEQIQDSLNPRDYEETNWVTKTSIFAYERPVISRIIFTSIFIILIILIDLYIKKGISNLYSGLLAIIASLKVFDSIFKEEYKDKYVRHTLNTSSDIYRSRIEMRRPLPRAQEEMEQRRKNVLYEISSSVEKAELYMREKKHNEALSLLTELPHDIPIVYNLLIDCLYELGAWDDLIALIPKPGNLNELSILVDALCKKNEFDIADQKISEYKRDIPSYDKGFIEALEKRVIAERKLANRRG